MSQPIIEITDTDVEERRGTSQKTGKPYCIRSQIAYLWMPGTKYPAQMTLSLGPADNPWPVGKYHLDITNFYVGQFGKLALRNELRLKPANQMPAMSGSQKAA